MSDENTLASVVAQEMGDLIFAYSLELISVDDDEVLLRSTTYSLDVLADKNGVSIVYFDSSRASIVGYNLFRFLLGKRRQSLDLKRARTIPDSRREFLVMEVRALSAHLRSAGEDLLRGEKNWISDYKWPVIHPSERIASLL